MTRAVEGDATARFQEERVGRRRIADAGPHLSRAPTGRATLSPARCGPGFAAAIALDDLGHARARDQGQRGGFVQRQRRGAERQQSGLQLQFDAADTKEDDRSISGSRWTPSTSSMPSEICSAIKHAVERTLARFPAAMIAL